MAVDNKTLKNKALGVDMTSEEVRRDLRNAFGSFATGVTVVITREADGTPRGFTANSFTSVSLDPPMLLVCIAKSAHSLAAFEKCSHFSINILGEGQREISGLFASKQTEKFDLVEWYPGFADIPLIAGAIATFVCTRENVVDAGDHVVLIGEVKEYARASGAPLGYFKGNYFNLGIDQPLVSAATARGRIKLGGIVSQDGRVLLCVDGQGNVSVPLAPEASSDVESLSAKLADLGLSPDLDFLYSVYTDNETGTNGIFYHGTIKGAAPDGYAYFPVADIPLDKVFDVSERSALGRYAAEYRQGSFGIYHGSETSGIVQQVLESKPSIS